jgi:hypothetical protein
MEGATPDLLILRFSGSYDPFTVTSLVPGVKPGLDLLDQSSYSLKFSLPLTWGPDLYGRPEEGGHFFSAGLYASVRLKSLPARYGSWTLSTGLFVVGRDQNAPHQATYTGDPDYIGGLGTVNISIVY